MQRDERGAVLIMVGVFTMAMFAMTAFVVDMGNQRQNRLQLATATDAAALDVGQRWANAELDGGAAGFASAGTDRWNCTTVARDIVRRNNDGLDADSVDCVAELEGDKTWGVVTVAASEAVNYQFGKAVGTASGTSRGTTSVKVSGAAQGGLRPFAVCAKLPAVKDFINGVTGPGDDVKVDAVKFLTPECGAATGNWGLLDLDGNGAKSVGALFAQGYNKSVKKSASAGVCETTTPESCFTGSPGAKWNAAPLKSALDFLAGPAGCEAGGPEFSVPTYDQVLDPNGKNSEFPLTGFLRVQLMCFTVGGSNLNSMTLKLVSYDPNECCSGVSATNRILEICDVGTITGALGPGFASSCGTPSSQPPVVGDGCVVFPIDPDKRDVIVDGSGFSIPPLHVDVTVDDATKCGPLGLRAVVHDIGHEVVAPTPTKSGDTYTFTFPGGTYFATGGTTLTFEVFEDDFVWDQTATVRTKLDDGSPEVPETCELVKVVSAPTKVNLTNGNPKVTDADAKWVLEFKTPSNCGTLKGMLHYSSGGNANMPKGDVSIGEVGVSSTVTFTLPKGSDLGHNAYWQPRIYYGDQVATPPLVLFG